MKHAGTTPMTRIATYLQWCVKAVAFFTFFAFALNNQGDGTVHFFFGYAWTAPMVLIVLAAFGSGLFVGILGMVPRWWAQRRAAARANDAAMEAPAETNLPGNARPHGL
jgi:uncharacterized integral membrane protein